MHRNEHLLEKLSMLQGKSTMHQGAHFAYEILQICTFIMNIGRIAAARRARENAARKNAPIRFLFHASHIFLMSTTNSIHSISAAFLRRLPETHNRGLWSDLQEPIQLLWRALYRVH
jgi:hypothetical protein